MNYLFDLNEEPTSSFCASDGEDNTSDLSDSCKPSSSKKRIAYSRKKRRKSSSKYEESSQEVGVLEHGDNNGSAMVQNEILDHGLVRPRRKKYARKARNEDSRPPLLWNIWEEQHERWIDENLSKDADLDHQSELMNETAEASSELTMPLLRYQKEWLAWALKQESSAVRGGILADEMGMGKTIQAIALVLAKREFQRIAPEPDDPSSLPGSSTVLPVIKGTLVICPVIAVTQWVSEIDRFTLKGSTKVLVYHGAKRGKSSEQFSEYDFVITTYSIVESEYRKYMMPPKEQCPYCGKLFNHKKLSIHQRYFCGPNAERTEKQSKQFKKKKREVNKKRIKEHENGKDQGADMNTKFWSEELEKGFNRLKEKETSMRADNSDATCREKSLLHAVKWQRIILDEVSCDHYCCWNCCVLQNKTGSLHLFFVSIIATFSPVLHF